MENQTNIFEMLYETYKINKPIRLITLFSGYDSQALALKYLGLNFEHYKTCEWAIKSIQALKDLHFENDNTDYSKDYTIKELKNFLYKKGISSNWNEQMTQQQVSRLSEKQVRTIYNNIKATHNLVNIQQVKGNDLCIKDTDKFTYLLTYSFPCQDLSTAGKGKGMSDTSTRSGMLWEVERILTECEEKPQILLMENVIQVHSQDNIEDFNKWQYSLEKMGYSNYWQDLIATDYGIPQTRNRCFMISILGDYNYTFPKPIPLKLKLKDLLEDVVDEKYYLSEKMLKYIQSRMPSGDNKITVGINIGNKESLKNAATLTTNNGRRPTDNYIIENDKYNYLKEYGKIIKTYDEYNKKLNGTDTIGTIQAMYSTPNHGHRLITKDLRIRKLSTRECYRLMGVKDEDYEKIAKNQSDSSLYHLAGDSIVVDVLKFIIKELI